MEKLKLGIILALGFAYRYFAQKAQS